MALAGLVLALANATAYSSALFDPVVILLAFLTAWPAGARVAARRTGALVTVTAALLIAGALLGGTSYLSGIRQTTLSRAAGSAPLGDCASWRTWAWSGRHLRAGRGRDHRQRGHPRGRPPDLADGRAGRGRPGRPHSTRPTCTPWTP